MIAVAWLMSLAGFLLIIHLSLPPFMRALAALAWLVESLRSLRLHAAAQAGIRRLELRGDGSGLASGSRQTTIRLLPGSLILGGIAWLRFETGDGGRFGELLLARDVGPGGWRRLNLLWRHGLIP